MYPSIPYVEPPIEEPTHISELEEAGVHFMFVLATSIHFWEKQGFYRAHIIPNTLVEELSLVCLYNRTDWINGLNA